MKREYWMRVAIVWGVLLGGVIVTVSLLLIPSFVLVATQLNAYQSQIVAAEALASEQETLVATVREANLQAAHLNEIAQVEAVSPYITLVDQLAGQAVSITQFTVARDDLKIETITLDGVARSRESLAQFRDALVADAAFVSADLPLSSLAANSDNIFTITITLAEPE